MVTVPDLAPSIEGLFGVDDDPETADDSMGAEGGSFPASILEPPAEDA
jgi:hypothetical protein